MIPTRNYAHQEQKTYEITDELVVKNPRKVLLLEDESDLAAALRELLEACDYRVTRVANGAEGLQHILAGDFDVIICDMVMPNFPGDMFYIAVQRSRPHLCSRFIFMTGHRADPKIDAFIRKVCGLVLWKPFQPHELLEAIKLVIRKHGGEPGA